MGFLTPEDIAAKATRAYERYLIQWIRGDGGTFFPYRIRARFSIDPKNPRGTIAASEMLLAKSKDSIGWGYTLQRSQVKLRDFGSNPIPKAITVETLEDLLRLAKRQKEFAATCRVVETVRAELSGLSRWLESKVGSLHSLADSVAGLVAVTRYFLEHPWPDCYARQISVAIDTKFVQRHESTLRQWLDLLLPASAIDVNETKFARRFGLRDDQKHRAVRVLDEALAQELKLPFCELSLPVRSIAKLDVSQATVVIVENDLNLLTLPPLARGLGIRGEGNAVNRLEQLEWLDQNRVFYWGDIDVDGFLILSRLRNLFPYIRSVLMDAGTRERDQQSPSTGSEAFWGRSRIRRDGSHKTSSYPTRKMVDCTRGLPNEATGQVTHRFMLSSKCCCQFTNGPSRSRTAATAAETISALS